MSEQNNAPDGASAEITFAPPAPEEVDTENDALPWVLRRRLTYEAYATRCRAAGRKPNMGEWLDHSRLTDEELQLLNDLVEAQRGSHCRDEIGPKFVIRHYGNKARVGWFDSAGNLATVSFEEFRNANIEKRVQVGYDDNGKPIEVPLAKYWLGHHLTRRYDRVEFRPGVRQEDMPEEVLNLWRGWPTGLRPGWEDYRLGPNGPEPSDRTILDTPGLPTGCGCDLFLEHMHKNMCGGDDDVMDYLLAWMADALCNHGPCETSVVLRGPQGSGKGFWAKRFMQFFGPHSVTLNNPRQLVGNFNKHLMDKSIVFADEAFFAGNKQHAASLKTLITDEELFIEPKGVDGFMAPKMFRVIMASNEEQVILAERDDRRNLVLDVDAGEHNDDKEYFGRIADEWRRGGQRILFRWLTGRYWRRAVAEGRFREWRRPVTRALQRQKDMSLPPAHMVVHNILAEGELPCECKDDPRQGTVFLSTTLLAEAVRLPQRDNTALGRAVRAVAGAGARNVRETFAGDRHRGYWLPPLALARQNWERFLGRAVEWPEDVVTWAVETARMAEDGRDVF